MLLRPPPSARALARTRHTRALSPITSYILQEAFPDTKLSLIGEEDSADLANQPETLAAVVTTVNEALNSPSARVGPLEHIGGVTLTPKQVCDAIDAGGSLGGKKGPKIDYTNVALLSREAPEREAARATVQGFFSNNGDGQLLLASTLAQLEYRE